MVLESACIPIPSEIVMPYAGYLAWFGKMNWFVAVLVGTFGNLIGSIIAYAVGYAARNTLLVKLKKNRHYTAAESWFDRKGDIVVLVSRLLPGVRTFISLPAGVAKSDFRKFILFTTIGSFPWCLALTLIGYLLGRNWERIHSILHPLAFVVIALILIWLVAKIVKYRNKLTDLSEK